MKPTDRVSPSKINARRLCPRRAWYERNRPRPPENEYAVFGTNTHKILEDWQVHGTPPDVRPDAPHPAEAMCAVAGLDLLPMPGQATAEHRFEMPFEGVIYNGRIDFLCGYAPGHVVVVGDHKTIGNLARCKTKEELLDDPQRIVYSRWAYRAFNVESVVCYWVYYRRKKPKAQAVSFSETRDEIERRFVKLHIEALQVVQDSCRPTPDHLPRNYASCGLFPPQGCPYRAECLATVQPGQIAAAAVFGSNK